MRQDEGLAGIAPVADRDAGPTAAATRGALRDRIADAVRSRIISGELAPGHRLREEDVAALFGVSRLPVREALTRLASEGFITLEKFRGATVATPSATTGLELLQLRRALEALAAELAAVRRGAEFADELLEVARRGTRLAADGRFGALPPMVDRFHGLVALASGNEQLVETLRQVRGKTNWLFAVSQDIRATTCWADHSEIAAAIAHGLPEVAAALMTRHVRSDEVFYRESLGGEPHRD